MLVGSGASKQAESEGQSILPNWAELIEDLTSVALATDSIDEGDAAAVRNLILQEKYVVAGQELQDRMDVMLFETFMRKRLGQDFKPGPLHRSLFKFRSPVIMTTNYDLLIEEAHTQVFNTLATVATPGNPREVFRSLKSPWSQASPVIFKLHGTIVNPESIVMAERDYNSLIYRRRDYRLVLRTIFMTRFVLMIGSSFSDPDIIEVLAEGMGGRNFIVLPKGKKDPFEMRRLLRTFGVDVVEYEPSDGHPELLELIEYLATFAPQKKIKTSKKPIKTI